jgi:hypothetical protein
MRLKDCGERGFLLTVTAWHNFGDVRTLYEERWLQPCDTRHSKTEIASSTGQIMSRFGGCSPSEYVPALSKEEEMIVFEVKDEHDKV